MPYGFLRALTLSLLAGAVATVGCSQTPPPESPEEGDAAMREAIEELEAASAELREAAEELRAISDALRPLADALGSVEKPALATEPPPRPPERGSIEGRFNEIAGDIEKVGERRYRTTSSVVETVLEHPAKTSRVRIVPSIKDGRANGFKLYAIRPSSWMAGIGLKNGDTVTALNGQELTSPDAALRIASTLRDADEIEVRLIRRGKPLSIHIEITED